MVGIQFTIQQPEDTAAQTPAANAEVTQHQPPTSNWVTVVVLAALAILVFQAMKSKG